MEIMVDYEKQETVTLKELMPNWWGKERYAEAAVLSDGTSPVTDAVQGSNPEDLQRDGVRIIESAQYLQS